MTYLHALVFSIVEGISEFLPISSTGHLMLAGRVMGLPQTEFLKSFEIAIQLGAILSVVVLYWKSFLVRWEELKRILCAFLPTAVIGFVLYKLIKKYLLADIHVVLASLFLGGIAIILFEKIHKPKPTDAVRIDQITYRQAFFIGLFQAVAVIPGVSRAAATIVGGSWLGVSRKTIVEFSFLLAVPTMAAATALDLLKNADTFSRNQTGLLAVGFAGSFVFALICIKWLLAFVKNHSFVSFGIYRILVAALFWVYLACSS